MTELKIDDVVDHLDSKFRKALADTMKRFAPDVPVNGGLALRYFKRRVSAKCSVWEKVPDSCVRK